MTYTSLAHLRASQAPPAYVMQSAQFQLHAEIEQRHWWFVARRQIVGRLIRDVLSPGQGHTVVDVGCGTGANLASLAGDYDCVGIDTSAEAIRLAAQRYPGVRFMQGFAPDDLGDVMERASLVTMMDVLEHVSDDFALLSKMLAASQPGTFFLLTVPADMSLWSQHDESFGHYRRYTLPRFRQIWDGLPVRELLATPYNSRLYPVVKLIRKWHQLRGKSSGTAGTDFNQPSQPVNRLLTSLFAGETRRLLNLLHRRTRKSYVHGVSLLALLQRKEGYIDTRTKPSELAGLDAVVAL